MWCNLGEQHQSDWGWEQATTRKDLEEEVAEGGRQAKAEARQVVPARV